MRLRRKQKVRLLIILGIGSAICIAGFGTYRWRQWDADRAAVAKREVGIRALEDGDYGAAVDGLGTYLRRFRDRGDQLTAEDYGLYARAVRNFPLKDGEHILGAISALRKALQLEPGDRALEDELLELYLMVGHTTEAQTLVDRMLTRAPDDIDLLATRADLFGARKDYSRALTVAERVVSARPHDLAGYIRVLELRLRLEQPASVVEEWAKGVQAAHADTTSFQLFRVHVLRRLLDRSRDDAALAKRAEAQLEALLASAFTPDDELSVMLLVGLLDGSGRFDDALSTLETAATIDSVGLRCELTRRLWYARRAEQIVDATAQWERVGDALGTEIAAMRALALHVTGDVDGAMRERDALRTGNAPDAGAWADLLDVLCDTEGSDAGRTREKIVQVTNELPSCALAWLALGDARAALGEWYLAEDAWTVAAKQAQSWSEPLRRIAAAMIGTDRQDIAPAVAEAALLRSRNDLAAFELLLRSFSVNADRLAADELSKLVSQLGALAEGDTGIPAERLRALELGLLVRTDRDAVGERLTEVLASEPDAGEATLLRLAAIADEAQTELASEFLSLSQRLHGTTPRLAFALANRRARDSGPEAGVREFERARNTADGDTDTAEWDLANAAILDAFGSPRAGPAWIEVADAQPDTLQAQLGALSSSGAWDDGEAIDRVIDRVKRLTGEEGVTWRLARARWLLNHSEGSEPDVSAAATLLRRVTEDAPRSVEGHVLLATALERLGRIDIAEEQLRKALELSPGNTGVALELARLATRQGHAAAARAQLEAVLGSGDLAPAQVARAAYVLAAQGEFRRSVRLLEGLGPRADAPRDGTLLLARLYARLGEHDRALTICQGLMDAPDTVVIELMATLLAATGRPDDADTALAQLDRIEAAPGDREIVRARYALRYRSPEVALEAFAAAANAAPARADVWIAYLEFAISSGSVEAVEAVLNDERTSGVETIAYLRSNSDGLVEALKDPAQQSLLRDTLTPGANQSALLRVIALLQQDAVTPRPRDELAETVRSIADTNPDLLSLQLLSAQLAGASGDLQAACETARRAAARHTKSVAAARQSALMHALAERWAEAVTAGLEWRERAQMNSADAESFVGDMLVRAGRADEAAAQLQPAVAVVEENPDAAPALVVSYAVALLRNNDTARCTALLGRLAARSEAWRGTLLTTQTSRLGTVRQVTHWIETVAARVPEDDVAGLLQVANAWSTAWEWRREAQQAGFADLRAAADAALARVTSFPDAPAATFFTIGTLALQSKEYAAAETAYREALRRDPRHLAARNNLAMALADGGHWQDAVEEAKLAVEQAPGSAELLDTLAYAYLRGDQHAEARLRLEAAIRLAPNNVGFLLNLAESYDATGERDGLARVMTRISTAIERGARADSEERTRIDVLRSVLDR